MVATGAQFPAALARLVAGALALGFAVPGHAGADNAVTTASLLREMTDRSAVARLPDPWYRCIQFSSYDRASVAPEEHDTWFANGDAGHFLRVEEHDGRTEHVMVDIGGPGAVVRIWSANPAGTLRVYLDGADAPALEWPMAELLAGQGPVASPLAHVVARGFNLYLPIPFARRCVITSDDGGFYYQVNVRLYAPDTPVATATATELESLGQADAPVQRALSDRLGPADELVATPEDPVTTVAPGGACDVAFTAQDRAVGGMLVIAPADATALRSLVLVAEFDGIRTIECPLGDFFGSGIGANTFADWYRRVAVVGDRAELRSNWVMPFRERAVLRVENRGAAPAPLAIRASTVPYAWNDGAMHFHASWRNDASLPVEGGRGTADWTMLAADGTGVMVGDSLAVANPVEAWWGEGDEKIVVDGEAFPSHFGTGTEDYYGYAWCCNEPFDHAFHAQPRCDGRAHGNNWGHTAVSRVRSLDAIPFRSSIRFDLELWHWKACSMAYAGTSFFYARPGARVVGPVTPANGAALEVPVPTPLPPPYVMRGAIEVETMRIAGRSEGLPVVVQDLRGFARNAWSGDRHLWVQGRGVGDFVEVEIPVEHAGRWQVQLHATRSWDYGIVRFSLLEPDSAPTVAGQRTPLAPSVEVNLFSGANGGDADRAVPSGPIDLGTVRASGPLRLRAEVCGRDPAARGAGAFFGLDCVILTPVADR